MQNTTKEYFEKTNCTQVNVTFQPYFEALKSVPARELPVLPSKEWRVKQFIEVILLEEYLIIRRMLLLTLTAVLLTNCLIQRLPWDVVIPKMYSNTLH